MGSMVVCWSLYTSSCIELPKFDLIDLMFMSPRPKTALATKSGIKLG